MGFKADSVTHFAGLNGQSTPDVPDAFIDKYGIEDPGALPRFNQVYHSLPIATDTTAGYKNPFTGEWVETERFNALVDPDKMERAEFDETVDPLWNIPTDNYGAVNPPQFYQPLEEAIIEAGGPTTCSVRFDSTSRVARFTWTSCSVARRWTSPVRTATSRCSPG